MTATYVLTTNIGKVRLLISDTDVVPETDAYFTDEEITAFLTMVSNSVNLAAAEALEAWAAAYSPTADAEKIGDYSYSHKIVDKMLALAKRLREKESETPALTWAEMNLTGENS